MSGDDMTLANRLAPVPEMRPDLAAAAVRAVLACVDRPVDDPRRLGHPEALDVLAMLGLVNDPRPAERRRRRG